MPTRPDREPAHLSRRDFLGALTAPALAHLLTGIPADSSTRVLAAVNDEQDLQLLQQMVRIRSYSGGGEEGALARFMVEELSGLDLAARLEEVEPGRFNALGVLGGTGGGRSLMLNGHLDTNPVGINWTVDPFTGLVRDGFIFGIGVSNMKASCAAFYGAARALVRSGLRLRGDLVLAYVVGELQGGIGTLKLLGEGIRADSFIVGEPTDLAVVTMHAGDVTAQINTLGITRHLSKMEEAVSAIDTMYKVIERLKQTKFSGPTDPDYASLRRLNVGSMRAGLGREYHDWRPAQVPDFASIKLSVRFGPGQDRDTVVADLRRELDALHREDPRVVTEVVPIEEAGRPPARAFEVSRDAAIVKVVVDAHTRIVGAPAPVGAVAPYRYYGSDASHLQHLGGMTGVLCGVGGKYNTMPDERVEIAQFHQATRIYALTALAMCA